MDYYSYIDRADISKREIPAYVMADFKRLFPQEAAERFGEDYSKRFPLDNFVEYVRSHAFHGENFSSHFNGFVQSQLSKERAAHAEAKRAEEAAALAKREEELAQMRRDAEAALKERARREYPFSDEAFEADWSRIRTELAVKEIAERRNRTASPRDYAHGVPGGFTTPLGPIESH